MLIAAVAVALLLVAGCGGGGTSSYSASATEDCLRGHGLSPDEAGADSIALDAPGHFLLSVGSTSVNVSFGGDTGSIVEQYRAVGGAGPDVHGNTVLVWDDEPSDATRELVVDCLS